jgi:predicted regulator of Ras-like GTPase activity (Roadblock/LC7/MglB family)
MSDELTMDSGALIFATLADVYLSSGMIDEAISILKDGLSRNPTYTLAKIILGRAYYMKGDIPEAIRILEEVYSEAKDSENTNLYLAHCYKKNGDTDKALTYYNNTLAINPDNKDAQREMRALQGEAGVPATEIPVQTTTHQPVIAEAISIVEKTADEESPPVQEPIPSPVPDTPESKPEDISKPVHHDEPVVQEAAPPENEPPSQLEEVHIPTAEPVEEAVSEVGAQKEESPGQVPYEAEPPTVAETQPAVPDAVEFPPDESVEEQEEAPAAPPPVEEIPEPAEDDSRDDVVEPGDALQGTTPPEEPSEQPVAQVEPLPVAAEVDKVDVDTPAPSVAQTEPVPSGSVVPFASLSEPMSKLLAMKTVKGAFICSQDGLLIQNYYQEYATIEELCAMVAAIHNEAAEAFRFLDEGEVEKFIIDKGDETVCVITAGESLLAVITKAEAKPGLVFIYARKVIEEIREILG